MLSESGHVERRFARQHASTCGCLRIACGRVSAVNRTGVEDERVVAELKATRTRQHNRIVADENGSVWRERVHARHGNRCQLLVELERLQRLALSCAAIAAAAVVVAKSVLVGRVAVVVCERV